MKLEQAAEVTVSNTLRTDKQVAETKLFETVVASRREPVPQATEMITRKPITIANASKEVVPPQTKVHAIDMPVWATQTEFVANTGKRTDDVECRQMENKATQTEENAKYIDNGKFMIMSLIILGFAVVLLYLSTVVVGLIPNITIHNHIGK